MIWAAKNNKFRTVRVVKANMGSLDGYYIQYVQDGNPVQITKAELETYYEPVTDRD